MLIGKLTYLKNPIMGYQPSSSGNSSSRQKTWVLKDTFLLLPHIQGSGSAEYKNPLRILIGIYKNPSLSVNKLSAFHNHFKFFPFFLQVQNTG